MHAVDYRVVGGYSMSAVNFQYDLYQRHIASGLTVNNFVTSILIYNTAVTSVFTAVFPGESRLVSIPFAIFLKF